MRCTIYSPVVDRQAIESVRDVLPGWLLHWEGEPARWSSASFTSAQGTLKFNSLEFTGPEDVFLKAALELARRLNGRVFNGTDLISPEPLP